MKKWRIAHIGRADNSGLGTMSWEYHRHLGFSRAVLVDNGRYPVHAARFTGIPYRVVRHVSPGDIEWLLEDADMLLTVETPYNWQAFQQKRIPTVLVPMYECTQHPMPYQPTQIWAPSLLDAQVYPGSIFVPYPVNSEAIQFKLRTRAQHFIHNAGHGGLGGRNGTAELVEAMQYVRSDIKLTIRSQVPIRCTDKRVQVHNTDYPNYWDLWHEGDVFVFPEKFNGLSLPIQEALCAGMPVMCSNRYPFNAYLPQDIMVPVYGYHTERIAYRDVQVADIDPRQIAQTIDEWAGWGITKLSYEAHALAKQLAWRALLPRYRELINNLCTTYATQK